MTRSRVYAAWTATRAVVFVLLLVRPTGGRSLFTDMRYYQIVGKHIADLSRIPYRDYSWEYPPGAVLVVTPPAFVGDYYAPLFLLIMVLADLAMLIVLLKLGERLGSRRGAWLWIVGILFMGPLAFARYDTVVALLAVLALAAVAAGAPIAAGIALGGGVVTKLWPALLLVVVPLVDGRRRLVVAAGAVVAATVLVVLAIGGAEYGVDTFRYHTERGLQVESVVATPVVVAQRSGAAVDIAYSKASGSYDVTGTGADAALAASTVLTLLAFAVTGLLLWRVRHKPEVYLDLAATTVLLFVIAGKVLSPQFLLWVLALYAAAVCRRDPLVAVPAYIVCGCALLGQLVYPVYYSDLVSGGGLFVVVVLTVRNVALLVAAALSVRALWRRSATP